MAFSFEIPGFGSKRKWALQVLDREWTALDIDIRRIDGGVRQLLFQWAQEGGDINKEALDPILVDLAAFSGFLMLGPELGARPFGADRLASMEKRLQAALTEDELLEREPEQNVEPSVNLRIVKLVLAAKLADQDIVAMVELEDRPD